MSSKQKKQSRRKGNKYNTSKSNTKTRKSTTKKSRNTKKKRSNHTNHKNKTDFSSTGLSLSPFYSFSNHWSYITRQYLCLSTWGTCMGGINEQYDDLLDQEASIPLAEESYKKAIDKWRKEKQNIQKYNRENTNKYERIRDEQLENAYNVTNKNTYNEYNVFNYPIAPKRNIYQKQQIQQQQQQPPPNIIKPIPRQINYVESHKVPEYSYIPNKFKQNNNIENVNNTENIYNVFNTFNRINNNENNNEYNMYQDNENNIYNKPSAVKYDKAENINNDNYNGSGDQENMESQNIYPNNESAESKQDLEDKMYKSGSDDSGSGSIGDNEESKSNDNNNNNNNIQYLTSPLQTTADPTHMKGKSFGRKFSMFEEAAELKKRKTIEEKEWKKQHHSGGDADEDGQFKPHDGNGVQYIQEYTYHPAAHHVQPHMPRKMSTKEYSQYMKEKEEPDAIITDNDVAALPAKDKIKLFSMLSAEQSIEKQ